MAYRTVSEHQRHIRRLFVNTARRVDATSVATPPATAVGSVLATDVYAPVDLPSFRNSSMDGYAVRAASLTSVPVTLPVTGMVAAGDGDPEPLPPHAAVQIMTGAPLPDGADCVVPVEHTDGGVTTVTIRTAHPVGAFIREPGTDVRRGRLLLAAGTVLAPRHVAALAAVGLPTIAVRPRPTAAVITTGNELVPAGKPLAAGQVYDSNGIALAAALHVNGVDVTAIEHSPDDPAIFGRILRAATDVADVVFTSGGVSMGEFEVVRETLTPLGGEFGHVAVQPGGPQGTTVVHDTPVLSFPGNPVSTMVSFEVFARPVLREIAGLPPIPVETMPIHTELHSPSGKRQFARGRRVGDGVEPVSGPGSHLIVTMAQADVLIDIPEEVTSVQAGSTVRVWSL